MPELESWDSLIDGNQGDAPPAIVEPPAPPANPSVEVAADPVVPSPDAIAPADPVAPAADAKPASADPAAAKVEPPATKPSGEATVDPPKDPAADSEEEETPEEKAEMEALPPAAQPAARRNRKEARQFRALKTAIGGEDFVEDASLIVPAFHTQSAAEFDAVLQERSPLKAAGLYNHMVYRAIDGVHSRPILINELITNHRSEVVAALGIGTAERQPESRVEPSATANADSAATAASLAVINALLDDRFASDEQTQALELAKKAITDKSATDTKLASIEEQLRVLTEEGKTSQAGTVAQQSEALGDEFIGEVMQFAETRLNELGLSAAEGDTPELVRFIKSERRKILDLLPDRFEKHENASKLISQLDEKFKKIPTLTSPQVRANEKRAAWKFLPTVKACADSILGEETASCLFAIEAARGARQAPLNQDPRKELVGHDAPPGGLAPQPTYVTGQGVDALWGSLVNPESASA